MIYAYARVSSKDQNLTIQINAFKEQGIEEVNIFSDKQSGKDFDRPSYQKLIKKLQKGDLVYLYSLDRLGRDYNEILAQWSYLTKDKGADIKVLDMPLLDTTQYRDTIGLFMTDLALKILSYQAETERTKNKQRQAEGIAAAKERGVVFGRPKKELPENFDEIYQRFQDGESINQLAKEYTELSYSTLRLRLYERMDEDRKVQLSKRKNQE